MPPADENASSTILLVEDEHAVRSFVLSLLTREGYSVITAVDGVDALEKAGRYDGAIEGWQFLPKPFMADMLRTKIRQTLKKTPEFPAGHGI